MGDLVGYALSKSITKKGSPSITLNNAPIRSKRGDAKQPLYGWVWAQVRGVQMTDFHG